MTLRTHWKKWAYKRKNIVLIYSDDSFFCLSQCLMYHCLALRLCLLGAVEVRLTLGAALGHAQDSCVWPFTVHLPVLVAAGLRVPVPVSDSKALVTVNLWELYPQRSEPPRSLMKHAWQCLPGRGLCAVEHTMSHDFGAHRGDGGPVTVGVTQRKILKRRPGHIQWRHLRDGTLFPGMCGLRAVVSWVWVLPTRARPATSWPVTCPTYGSVLLWLWGVAGQRVLESGSVGQSGDAAEAARVPWHCDGDVQRPGRQWSRVVRFHQQKRTPWSAPIPITCTLPRSQPPNSCVVPWPQPASSSAQLPLSDLIPLYALLFTSLPCSFV